MGWVTCSPSSNGNLQQATGRVVGLRPWLRRRRAALHFLFDLEPPLVGAPPAGVESSSGRALGTVSAGATPPVTLGEGGRHDRAPPLTRAMFRTSSNFTP